MATERELLLSAAEADTYIVTVGAFYGTITAIQAIIEQFIDAGCGGFMTSCNASPALDSLDQRASLRLLCATRLGNCATLFAGRA